MILSSPVSVQLCDDFEDFEAEVFDLKCFKDSQALETAAGISPSQIDPLGEFSQVPEEEVVIEDEDDDDEEGLMNGPIFNTQMTDLKDDDEIDAEEEEYFIQQDEEVKRYGTDGYVRYKIPEISGSTDPRIALNLIKRAKKIVIVSGAGISVSAGIPDFRSEGRGLYALLDSFLSGERSEEAVAFFGGLKEWQLDALQRLDEPESLFDLEFFLSDPHPFYAFLLATRFGAPSSARFSPTPSHHVIASLPNLLLSFTQNIDTLEASAGLAQVCYCHGSFESVSCVKCRAPHDVEYFWKLLEMYTESNVNEVVNYLPVCQYCTNSSFDSEDSEDESSDIIPLLKPDIVFFGESLPANFFAHIRSTLPACDLLIVTGSSMKVLPVASIPDLIPPTVPQILINKEPILDHNFDLELLGEADLIWSWIGKELNLKCQDHLKECRNECVYAGNGRFLF